MIFHVSNTSDPFFNLALEELLIRNSSEEYTVLSINEKSVITGKHQCAHRESDTKYVIEHEIPVIRRISGGGTVYHDPGNLNFTFIYNCESGKQVDFEKYTRPVIRFLNSIGLNAILEGSDIRVNDMKISGNAEHVFHKRVMHHGTILFDASLDTLRNSLRKDTSSYITRAVPSNPAHVTNLSELTSRFASVDDLQNALLSYLLDIHKVSSVNEVQSKLKEDAKMLAVNKYSTWEWNYAYGPEYDLVKISNIFGKKSKIKLSVRNGLITGISAEGNVSLEKKLVKLEGCRHMYGDLKAALADTGLGDVDVFEFF